MLYRPHTGACLSGSGYDLVALKECEISVYSTYRLEFALDQDIGSPQKPKEKGREAINFTHIREHGSHKPHTS